MAICIFLPLMQLQLPMGLWNHRDYPLLPFDIYVHVSGGPRSLDSPDDCSCRQATNGRPHGATATSPQSKPACTAPPLFVPPTPKTKPTATLKPRTHSAYSHRRASACRAANRALTAARSPCTAPPVRLQYTPRHRHRNPTAPPSFPRVPTALRCFLRAPTAPRCPVATAAYLPCSSLAPGVAAALCARIPTLPLRATCQSTAVSRPRSYRSPRAVCLLPARLAATCRSPLWTQSLQLNSYSLEL